MTKQCTKCREIKPLSAFTADKRTPGKYRAQCKVCKAAYARDWADRNRERERTRLRAYRVDNLDRVKETEYARRVTRHGLTVDQYEQMLDDQNGLCMICHKREAVCIDHDHTCCSGTYSCGTCVRGILCHQCNRGIGLLGDDPETITRVIAYLKR